LGLRTFFGALSSAALRKSTKSWKNNWSAFLGTEDTILFSSCFDANGGVFEPLLDDQSAIISDELNHASIIDGIRPVRRSAFGTAT
jgi:7-keto-8-aminopelargonate synthetase-like enzyme